MAKGRSLATLLMLIGLGMCFLLTLDPDNADWGGSAIREIKFAPLVAMLLSSTFLLLTVRIRWTPSFVLMFAFAIMMLAGSLYSLVAQGSDLEETYLSRGLIACSSLLAGYLVVQRFSFVQYVMPKVVYMLFAYAWGVAFLSVLYRIGMAFGELTQIYQVQSGLVSAALLLTINPMMSAKFNKISFVIFVVTLLLIAKTTALLMLAITLAVLGYFHFTLRFSKLMGSHATKMIALFGILVTIAAASVFLYQDRVDDRGNDTRESNMEIRIGQFKDSPFVGDLFTGSPLVDFGPLHIPSHSEWLDMFASSGVLALFLLVFPAVWLIFRSAPLSTSSKGLRLQQWLALVVFEHAVLMTVNPILFMPSLAIQFWLMLGLLAGLYAQNEDYYFVKNRLIPIRESRF